MTRGTFFFYLQLPYPQFSTTALLQSGRGPAHAAVLAPLPPGMLPGAWVHNLPLPCPRIQILGVSDIFLLSLMARGISQLVGQRLGYRKLFSQDPSSTSGGQNSTPPPHLPHRGVGH